MSTEWITDRLPTKSDLVGVEREVWYYCSDQGFAFRCHWSDIKKLGEPWQPIHKPAPYVKPNRCRVRWDANAYRWYIVNNYDGLIVATLLVDADALATAQRICDIFNEVMP
jgi:hypothetical protein